MTEGNGYWLAQDIMSFLANDPAGKIMLQTPIGQTTDSDLTAEPDA